MDEVDDDTLSAEDALKLVSLARRVPRFQGGLQLTSKGGLDSSDLADVQRYRFACAQLSRCSPSMLGLSMFPPDTSILTEAQKEEILNTVVRPLDGPPTAWQRRRGSGANQNCGVVGTQRRTFGVELDDKYRVVGRSEMPAALRALGERLLSYCRSRDWPYALQNDLATHVSCFEQAYVQRYVPGEQSATLGFHFDSFSTFGELIVGVTLQGEGELLLRKCGPQDAGDFVRRPAETLASPRTLRMPLRPLGFYALCGLARYDLKHAIVCPDCGPERISITFRTVNWSKVRRERSEGQPMLPPSVACKRIKKQNSSAEEATSAAGEPGSQIVNA